MAARAALHTAYTLILCIFLTGCYGQNADSPVENWWYTETPQGYTEQGTAVLPVGSPLPTVGGNNTSAPSSGKR